MSHHSIPVRIAQQASPSNDLLATGSGIYCILNRKNGRRYVGCTALPFKVRWKNHRNELRRGDHYNQHLQRAWDKYGEESFEFVVLEECPPGLCLEREEHWMDRFKTRVRKHGYNVYSPTRGPLGVKRSAEFVRRLVERNKGKKLTAEHRARISAGLLGNVRGPMSEETKRKISESHKGKALSPEHRRKISAGGKGRVESEETRAKRSNTYRVRSGLTPEAVAEIRTRYTPRDPHNGMRALAVEFDVSPGTVWRIARRQMFLETDKERSGE